MPWVSYADRFEDVLLHRSLADISLGFYVDIGPADPTKGSLTKHFSDCGWRGINVIAGRETLAAFCASRPRDLNFLLTEGGEGLSFCSAEGERFFDGLEALLQRHGIQTIHFLKAAGSGWQEKLLCRFPFSRMKPWIVILVDSEENRTSTEGEHLPTVKDRFLVAQGYELAYCDGRSRFYLAREQLGRKERLVAAPCLADDFVPYRYAEEIDGLHKQRAELAVLTKVLSQEARRLHEKRLKHPLRRAERLIRSAFQGRGQLSTEKGATVDRMAVPSVGALEVRRLSGIQGLGNRLGERPRILALQLDHIGDFVMRLPAFRLLRSLWPAAKIDLVCGPWNVALAQRLGSFQDVLSFPFFPEVSGRWRPNAWEFERIRSGFSSFASRLGEYDLAIDLRVDPDTRPLLGLVRAKLRAGYAAPGADVVLDISLPNPDLLEPGETNRYGPHREVSAILLIRAVEAATAAMWSDRARFLLPNAPRTTQASARLVAVAPGSGGTARKWKVEHYAEVCRSLASVHRCSLLLVGSAGQETDAERIVREIPASQCRNLVGKIPLAELPELLAEAQVFVGNDSGASHIAASLGIPTVVAYSGAADFRLFHPVGEKVSVLRVPISCSPCWRMRAEECPFGTACLEGISPEAVVAEVLFWLGEAKGSEPRTSTG
ncbi:ADP-heptose--LPS heptosyltransferase 2 [Methylacidimicrobium cyclopophantes]|uniref:ADP-heptose--LPS heptosyltransferase 2 n=1 Tax=Methylacidimicrobium cyclopophantes TaxID=1041766 RepID=A0A5E6MLU1_9BACT|nr:glycosyltransferase family 9 protein [Methylacidimicrobium cyclopophantes]VVM07037.1 ADP-heptose--LPS heptosyltransferase 2 [Methylacidimicrobium cyclopophantes]